MSASQNKIKYLIADTTAFINAVPLNDYAENVLTVPEVLAEVRNKRQIRRLCVLPFDLQIREPSVDSVKYCVEFAKKTGDYASLSGIDLKVIALTYELEVQNVGDTHLRKNPVVSQVIASSHEPKELQDNSKLAGWYIRSRNESYEHDDSSDFKETTYTDLVEENTETDVGEKDEAEIASSQEELDSLFDKLKCTPSTKEDSDTFNTFTAVGEFNKEDDCFLKVENTNDDANDDDDEFWITSTNIKNVKKAVEEEIVPQVACMTTDYALQNVLKQINLNVAALDGRVIKKLKTYILRCYTCFKTTSIITKVFCPNCGNKTLKRVTASLDENGKQIIHINTRRPLTRKFKNQSLPRFQGGKHSRNPILFEDQPIPRQMPTRVAKTKTNALEEDYIVGFSPFVMRDVDSKSAILRSKGQLKEWARNNHFEEDRRRKNYNRLHK